MRKEAAANFFRKIFFTDCLPDKIWQGSQNCIQLVQRKVSPPFSLKNQIFTKKGLWGPEVSGRVVRTAFYVTRVTFWEEQILLKQKKIFLSSFPTFCRNLSKFRILFGRLGKRFRDFWWNWTPLVQTKVLVAKTFCRISHVYKIISSWSEKSWDLVKKVFSTVVTTAS